MGFSFILILFTIADELLPIRRHTSNTTICEKPRQHDTITGTCSNTLIGAKACSQPAIISLPHVLQFPKMQNWVLILISHDAWLSRMNWRFSKSGEYLFTTFDAALYNSSQTIQCWSREMMISSRFLRAYSILFDDDDWCSSMRAMPWSLMSKSTPHSNTKWGFAKTLLIVESARAEKNYWGTVLRLPPKLLLRWFFHFIEFRSRYYE